MGQHGTREEIRLACVFNGGVSLAVWMGGVAHEINELTADGAVYGPLLRLLGVTARADVISGTSAGGINGAALALAQVNRHTDLTDLRRVWAEQGRLETLLHTPFQGDPTSLLRGEEVFLPELTRALQRLATPWEPRSVTDRPVDLTVTTTLLDGVTLEETDSFGQPLSQHRHDAYLRFARAPDGAGRVRDDFSALAPPAGDPDGPPVDVPNGEILAALALAARASAGFPVAFEPTLLPVDPAVPTPGRPDMAPYASWRGQRRAGESRRPDRSRYAVDGGLLNNTPTQHSLAAIEGMRADLAVDRVMLLVVPLPSGVAWETGAGDGPPTLTGMAQGLAASVTSTGSRTFVDDVVRHNRSATSLRCTRADILAAAGSAPGLRATAEPLYPHYRRLRMRRDARDLAAQPDLPPGLAYDQARAALEGVQAEHAAAGAGAVPVSFAGLVEAGSAATWPWGTKPLLDVGAAALEYLARLLDAWPEPDPEPVLGARAQVHDALAQVRWVRHTLDEIWQIGPALRALRPDRRYWQLRLATDAWLLQGSADGLQRLTAAAAALGLDAADVLAPTLQTLHTGDPGDVPELGAAGGLAGLVLGQALARVLDGVLAPTRPRHLRRLGTALTAVFDPAWQPVLTAASEADDTVACRATWHVLAALHVTAWTIGDELPTENTNPLRLTQLSAATPNDFATHSRTVEEKLGGASLARFSGFLKRSWRMNDWAWGRCDGASVLMRVLLVPRRVREVSITHGLAGPEDVVDLLLRTAWGEEAAQALLGTGATIPSGRRARLDGLRAGAVREVAAALRATRPPELSEGPETGDAPAMPDLAALLTYARHVGIVHEELPEIAAAVHEDAADGANLRSRGQLFLTQHATLLERLATTRDRPGTAAWLAHGLESLTALDRAGVGREPLDEEGASDQLIRTAVTAAAVTATVAAGRRSGLGVLAPVTRALKGATMLPYWVTQGLTSGGLVARFLGILGLAAGGVLLTLALLGLLDGALAGVAATLGAGAFLAALTYGAMRTGSYLHGVVLALAAAALLGAGLSAARGRWELSLGIGAVLGAAVLVGGLTLLGSLRQPMKSPKVLVEDAGAALARRVLGRPWAEQHLALARGAGLVVIIVLLGSLVVVLVAQGAARLDRLGTGEVEELATWLLGAAVALIGVLATLAVLLASRGLRRWVLVEGKWQRERSSGSAGVAAGWSVVYGVVLLVGCGLALRWWPEDEDVVWTIGWVVTVLAALAAAFMVPVPLLTLWRARRRVRHRAASALERVPDVAGTGDLASRRAAWLEANGWAYSAVVRKVTDDAGEHLELRPHHRTTP